MLSLAECPDDLERRLDALLSARADHVVPTPPVRVGHDVGLAGEDAREEAHAIGVVGHHQEVERAGEPDGLARRGDQLLALGEAVGVARREAGAEGASVHREACVDVGVAPVDVGREAAIRVGRIRAPLESALQAPRLRHGLAGRLGAPPTENGRRGAGAARQCQLDNGATPRRSGHGALPRLRYPVRRRMQPRSFRACTATHIRPDAG